MKEILSLKAGESLFLYGGIYIIKSGKVLSKQIFDNGKVLLNTCYLEKGELIGNFFGLSQDIPVPEFYIEIIATKDTVLEKIHLSPLNTLKEGSIYQKIIYQLLIRINLEIHSKIVDKKEFILFISNLLSNPDGSVDKKIISPEIFNMSKSQYYLILSKLNEEKKISDGINKILLLLCNRNLLCS